MVMKMLAYVVPLLQKIARGTNRARETARKRKGIK